MYILSTLYHYWTKSQLHQPEGGKQSARALAHYDNSPRRRHIWVGRGHIFDLRQLLIDKHPNRQVDINRIMACVYTLLQYPHTIYCTGVNALLT